MAYVPVLGFIIAAIRTLQAQYAANACFASSHTPMDCQPLFDATWQPFNDLSTATLVTNGFFIIAIITLRFLSTRQKMTKTATRT